MPSASAAARSERWALRSGHAASLHPVGFTVAVERGVEFRERPLARCGGLFRAERGKGERSPAAQALQARVAACVTHAEGDEPPLERVHSLPHEAIEGLDAGGVLRRVAGGHDLGDVGAVAEATRQGHLQDFHVRRALEVVEGADDFRAALAAELLKMLAHLGRGLDLEVGETGARLDGHA